jgi:F420-0:gamma-glutamyl ligase-like protein
MTKYTATAITTEYWKPGENYLKEIIKHIQDKLVNGDIIVISEKALAVATNNIIDENTIKASLNAKLIAHFWMRTVWAHILGPICHFPAKLLRNLREYPLEAGAKHKQTALNFTYPLRTLMYGSEGGIDGSNLPYSLVSLPLKNADKLATIIRNTVKLRLQKETCVMISDTDKTYTFHGFHWTPRPTSVESIHSFGGVFAYVAGRMLYFKRRSTPVAMAGCRFDIENALKIAEAANRARGHGAGRNVWEMAENFGVSLFEVTWEMLDRVRHKPIVIVRAKR